MSKSSRDKFSKTLSLPVKTWSQLEEIRGLTRMPDLSIALQDCIESKLESITLTQKLEHARMTEKEDIEDHA